MAVSVGPEAMGELLHNLIVEVLDIAPDLG
jgi:hypothetical protein